uniref:RNA-dependent RNA polymerase n=1 Tax=Rhizoctonia solani partitivirus 20 TaxID=3162544 RepID=A0A8F5AI07_9VIRU|nr:RNA-dependent RNA polymerase [Rhizoctonia solani partitivirus 10]
MKFLNLLKIGFYPKIAPKIHGRDPKYDEIHNPLTQFVNHTIDFALNKYLSPEEADTVINGYRRSPWNEDALNKDIEKLNSEEHPVLKDEHYNRAIEHVFKLIKPDVPLKPVHFADLPRYNWRLSTNIGAPFNVSDEWKDYVTAKYTYFKEGKPFDNIAHRDLFTEAHKNSAPLEIRDNRMTKHNLYTEAFFITRKNIHRIKEGKTHNDKGHDLRYWNTAFARQHLVKAEEEDKVRLVFGAPFTLLTAELMFLWPLQIHLLLMTGSKSFMLWGYETLLGGWYRLRNFFANHIPRGGLVATLDWSGFDRFARHTVIRDIHARIMRPCFTFSEGYHPTVTNQSYPEANVIERKLDNLWNWMTDSVLTIPLLLPDGTMYRFQHSGIFSGYFQTQILDSLYNLVMIFTILSRMGFDLDKVVIKVQGDDSIFIILCVFILICNSFLTLFAAYAKQYFGAILSEKKSEIRPNLEDAEVLKYRNRNGIPYRDELALLAQLRHPERSTKPEDVAARCVGIAFATCGQLPRTYLICEDIYNHLTKKKGVVPRQAELDYMFRYLQDESPQEIKMSAAKFPTLVEVTAHLLDGPTPLANKHWPRDYFIGLPGRR